MSVFYPVIKQKFPAKRSGTALMILVLSVLVSACSTAPVAKQTPHHSTPRVSALEKNLPNTELTPDIFFNVLVGEIAGHRGLLDVAVASLGQAARKSRDPRLAARASQAALYAKLYPDAQENAQLWVTIQPENLEARETLATVFLESGQPVKAQQQLEEVLLLAKKDNNLDQMFLRIAGILGRHKSRTTGFEIMESLANQYKHNPHATLALANLSVRVGDLDKALVAINHSLELSPSWDEAALYKGRVLVSRKEMVKARQFYTDYLDDNPGSTKVRLNYARLLVDSKQWEKARKEFVRVVKDAPDDAESIFAVGLLAYQAQRYDEAQFYLERHLELRPENDQAKMYLGQIAGERKDYVTATRWYEAISSPNYYFEAQTRLGIAMWRMGNLQAARDHLQSIKTTTEKQKVQLVLAEEQILREAKKYQEALKFLNIAIVELPEQTDVRYARALIAEKLNMVDLSISDLRAILEKEPDNAHALNALGYTLADRTDKLDEAKKLITQALKQKPNDPFVLDSMGWVHYRMGHYDEAIKYLRLALSMRSDAEISAHLGEVLWVSGDRSTARVVWRHALESTPDNESLLSIIKKYSD
ncbi:MAG: tetratricopeptide repeat protein [Acidiferrobacterales bacterium]